MIKANTEKNVSTVGRCDGVVSLEKCQGRQELGKEDRLDYWRECPDSSTRHPEHRSPSSGQDFSVRCSSNLLISTLSCTQTREPSSQPFDRAHEQCASRDAPLPAEGIKVSGVGRSELAHFSVDASGDGFARCRKGFTTGNGNGSLV